MSAQRQQGKVGGRQEGIRKDEREIVDISGRICALLNIVAHFMDVTQL